MRNERYFRFKELGLCTRCGAKRARNSSYCRKHKVLHREDSRKRMEKKRAADPVYRELERYAVRKRMRGLRADPNYQRPDRPVRC